MRVAGLIMDCSIRYQSASLIVTKDLFPSIKATAAAATWHKDSRTQYHLEEQVCPRWLRGLISELLYLKAVGVIMKILPLFVRVIEVFIGTVQPASLIFEFTHKG